MTDTLYDLHGIRKERSSTFALQIDELQVRRGETLALLGPTGAGKSTLLRLLAGLESPTRGEIRFDGQPFTYGNLPLHTRRRITMVYQRPSLLTGTVRYNIEYGLKIRGLPHTNAVDAILKCFRLENLAAQSARTLSGGQTQLVAVARALVFAPDILLLDEPTSNLDPAHVALVEEAFRSANPDRPNTIVWATHNLFQARRIAQRVALLWDGKLVEVAATEQFFDEPTDSRTADFVQGKMIY